MCLYHVSDNTLVDLILVLILILIKEFIESTTDNVSIVFTSQYILVVVKVVRQSDFVIKSIESTSDNVSIVFTSQYIHVVVEVRQSDFVIEFIESTIFTNNKFQIVFVPCI